LINQNKCRKFVKQMRKRFPEPQKKNKKSFKKDLTNQKESLKFVKRNRKSPKEFFEKSNYPFRMFDDETRVVDFE